MEVPMYMSSLVTVPLLACNLIEDVQQILLVRHSRTFRQAKGMQGPEGENRIPITTCYA